MKDNEHNTFMNCRFWSIIYKDTNTVASYAIIRNMISSVRAESEDEYKLCSYCHRIRPCRGPNNICTECINEMRVSASLD
jgi:hypothetical protein